MHIGFTYDLRDDYLAMGFSKEETAEFDAQYTIDSITETLESLGHTVERIGNIWSLTQSLASGKKWDLVFNIAEGLYGMGRESQIPNILEAYSQPFTFSPAHVIMTCHDKSLAKLRLQHHNLKTAKWQVVHDIADVQKLHLNFPLFAKPIAEGTGKGVSAKSILYNLHDAYKVCEHLLTTFQQSVLIEEYLSGREFTVGILGEGESTTIIGVMEIISLESAELGGHTYENKENFQTRMQYLIPQDDIVQKVHDLALQSWKILGCRDAGRIDIRCDSNGEPHFLEVNPLPGLHAIHSDLTLLSNMVGMNFQTLIKNIVDQASKRIITATKSHTRIDHAKHFNNPSMD